MSSELVNLHIDYGEPCGELPEREQMEDWVVDLVRSGIGTFNSEQLDELRVIGAYINNKEHDESKRKEAINAFNSFYEIATCR